MVFYKNAPEAKYKSQNVEQNVEEAAKWLALSGYGGTEIESASEITKVTNYSELIQFKEDLYDEFNDISCLYFPHKDSKSKEKLRKAKAAYAQNSKDENVICVFDNTLFGGADDGFLVTDKKIYAHNAYAKDIIVIPFGEIKSFGIIKNSLLINGTIEISIGNGGNSAKKTLPIMLEKIKCALAGDKL